MLSWVGRARCLLCVFLFMPFNSNRLPKVTLGQPPGTETSMYKIRRAVQSIFCSGKSRAPSERNSCREAAQSNHSTSPDAAMSLVFHVGRQRRGASEFLRSSVVAVRGQRRSETREGVFARKSVLRPLHFCFLL